ncbi:hypothetical protein ACCO45_010701 [Purpureocillium lilacinum]|uniref:Uncharacterized protein n=1 Tax=Purpureocillium lilacinum TaxID=33203 RepID=A0ACC4DGB4_PURLI
MSSTPHEPRKLLKPTDGPDVPQPALSRPEPRPGTPARSRKSQATAACESREAVARFGWRASAGVVVGPVSNVARQQSMAERGAESSAAIDISPSATRRGARCHDTEHGARRTDGQPTSWPSNAREDPPWIVLSESAPRSPPATNSSWEIDLIALRFYRTSSNLDAALASCQIANSGLLTSETSPVGRVKAGCQINGVGGAPVLARVGWRGLSRNMMVAARRRA